MPRPPKISVLVKAYNHAPYVAQTIRSVLDQSCQDFEIVFTDDGSSDDTLSVAREFDDPRLRIEALPENGGISAAMNATIARARGRYLAILNSDDYALPERLARQSDFLDGHADIGLVFGMPRIIDEHGHDIASAVDFTAVLQLPDFSERTWLRQFFYRGNCLCAPTAMIRREAYAAVGVYDTGLINLQDFDIWVRMVVAGQPIHVLPDELTALRIRDGLANESAARPDATRRASFEITRILRRFAGLGPARFEAAFGSPDGADDDVPMLARVAMLAGAVGAAEYQVFALAALYECADGPAGYRRLRAAAGTLDPFARDMHEHLHGEIARLGKELARSERRLAVLTDFLRRQRKSFEALHGDLRASVARHQNETTLRAAFDEAGYLAANPAVAEAVAAGHLRSGFHHWLSHGLAEGRFPGGDV